MDNMSNNTSRKRLTGDERKALIIKNTIDLVSEKGFSVTTKDIANKSQINEALIFQHFKTKKELMNAVISDIFHSRTMFIGAMKAPSTEQEFIEKLYLYEKYFLKQNSEDAAYLKIVLYYILEQYSYSDEINLQINQTFLKWVYDAIEKGKSEWNYNKNVDTQIAISTFIGGFIFYILKTVIIDKAQIDVEKAEHKFVEMFINSLHESRR